MQPDRGSSVLEKGCYMLNFNGCHACGEVDMPKAVEEERTGDGVSEVESISFTHVCRACEHVVAKHCYTFEVQGEFQVFEMQCPLCGFAQHEASIEPFDPRLAPDPLLM